MGCGCGSKNKTSTTAVAAPTAQLFEVIDGAKIVFRTRVESIAKTKADAIPGGRYRPAGQP